MVKSLITRFASKISDLIFINRGLAVYELSPSRMNGDGGGILRLRVHSDLHSLLIEKSTKRKINRVLESGGMVYVYQLDCKVVSIACVAFEDVFVSEVDAYFQVNEESCYIYSCFTESKYRGRGFYARLLEAVCNDFSDRKVKISCLLDNYSSIKVIRKLMKCELGVLFYNRSFSVLKSYRSLGLSNDRFRF